MTSPITPSDIAAARYVSLVTFKRNGDEVATAVWIAPADGKHYVFSAGEAWKVKRLRHTPQVRLALCTGAGRVTSAWCDGSALMVEDPKVIAAAYRSFRQKYGIAMWLADLGAKLSGRFKRRAIIEIVM